MAQSLGSKDLGITEGLNEAGLSVGSVGDAI